MPKRKLSRVCGALAVAFILVAAGLSFPGHAWALATVSVLSSPNVSSSFTGNLGTVQIAGMDVSPSQSDNIILTMPGGITLDQNDPIPAFVSVPQYNPGTTVQNAFWAGANNDGSVVQSAYVSTPLIGSGMLSFWITAAPSSATFSGTGSVLVNLPVSSVAGAGPGPINITVSDTDKMIPRETAGSGILVNNPGEAVAIETTSLPVATAGQPYNTTVITSGGFSPYSFSISSGQLPPGLALSSTAGTLSGTPSTAGSYSFTVTVKDNTVYTASQTYTLTVNPQTPVVGSSPAQSAPPQPNTILFTIGSQSYTVNGQVSKMDVVPVVDQASGHTLVPVRYLAEALGVVPQDITWDAETQTVTLIHRGTPATTMILTIGSKVMEISGLGTYTSVQMDIAPTIVSGRTMLPARWVAQQFGYTVQWNAANRQVILTQTTH